MARIQEAAPPLSDHATPFLRAFENFREAASTLLIAAEGCLFAMEDETRPAAIQLRERLKNAVEQFKAAK